MPQFMLGYKITPADNGADAFLAELEYDLACDALAGKSSALYASLYADGLINNHYDYGYFGFSGGACMLIGGESRNPDAVRNALAEAVDAVRRIGLNPKLFNRLKRAAYGNYLRQMDDNDALCRAVIRAHCRGYDYFSFPDIFESLTPESAAERLIDTITPDRVCLSRIDPV